jgi:hypothetical protein
MSAGYEQHRLPRTRGVHNVLLRRRVGPRHTQFRMKCLCGAQAAITVPGSHQALPADGPFVIGFRMMLGECGVHEPMTWENAA